jgi:hypothetical protein
MTTSGRDSSPTKLNTVSSSRRSIAGDWVEVDGEPGDVEGMALGSDEDVLRVGVFSSWVSVLGEISEEELEEGMALGSEDEVLSAGVDSSLIVEEEPLASELLDPSKRPPEISFGRSQSDITY